MPDGNHQNKDWKTTIQVPFFDGSMVGRGKFIRTGWKRFGQYNFCLVVWKI